ncbi:MAG: serine/threonine-protein kinase [Alphaproteobacteria bacterium]|nr:serine/threonine-protein kinase [Alphaproteobacteria bacterium]
MSASDRLVGLDLVDGWRVTRHLARNPNGSGGTFSQSYEAQNGGRIAFVKAFDFDRAFEPDADTLVELNKLTGDYMHERAVLDHCQKKRLSNVVVAIGHGSVQVPGLSAQEGLVYYILFEKADGDVRCQMDVTKRFDTVWCLAAMKDVSLGLWQVHKEFIAHQDTKPSNILTFAGQNFKVADFGRSSWRGVSVRHDDYKVAGDRSYAPPELLYGMVHQDFAPRRIGCDLYMMGNLVAFLFSGVNVTAHLLSHLDRQHHPSQWKDTYDQALPYLNRAFSQVIDDIAPRVDEKVRAEIVQIISELCAPDLLKRGHPKGIARKQQYSLERYVAKFEMLLKRAQVMARSSARAA